MVVFSFSTCIVSMPGKKNQTTSKPKKHFTSVIKGTMLRKKGLILEGLIVLLLYGVEY